MAEYDLGDLIRASTAFTNTAGVATDPTVITVMHRVGIDTVSTYVYGTDEQVAKDSTGNYHIDILADTAGVHFVRWTGTGTITAADEDTWVVKKSRII